MSQNSVFYLFQGITFRRKPELYVFHSEHSVILQSVAKCRGSRVATKSRGSRVWVVGAGAGAGKSRG